MRKLQKAILRTLAYADVFDYPLTMEEIWQWLIKLKIKKEKCKIEKSSKIQQKNNFYFLAGKKELAKLRQQREKWSRKKIKIAKKVARWLKLIPWVKMVGVTGGLAILNSDEEDDIDLLIVSAQNRLWLSRFFTVFWLEILGKRRRPSDKEVKDKICLNMFLTEDHLQLPPQEQDLFSAHEVCQMKVLWEKEGTYQKFLKENQWAKNFLSNMGIWRLGDKEWKQRQIATYQNPFSNFLENFVKTIQLRYMRRRTKEVINNNMLRFHPQDAREWVLSAYFLRLKKLGLDN